MEINIRLDKAQLKKKGHPLVITIYISKTDKLKRYTGYYSDEKDWDFLREEPKKSHPLYIGILDFILEKRREINNLLNSRVKLTSEQVYNKIFKVSGSFYDFWEERIKEIKNEGSRTIYENTLKEFRKYKKEVSFNDIDYSFLVGFKLWKKETCSNNTLNTYLSKIKAVYNEGVRRGIHIPQTTISPFYKIMEKGEKTKDKYLTINEMKIIVKNPNKTKYDQYFLLCFFLGGLDFIDIAKLEHSHISKGRVRFERFKGRTQEIIDNKIFPEAEEIINYFGEDEYLTDIHRFALKTHRDNYISRYRNYLKGLGITSYVSSKSARYTFINIGKELQLNREVVMELTGHSRKDVHSIYEGNFSNEIKDEVHRKIIDAVLV